MSEMRRRLALKQSIVSQLYPVIICIFFATGTNQNQEFGVGVTTSSEESPLASPKSQSLTPQNNSGDTSSESRRVIQQHDYKTVGPEDDEVHDEEIIQAVRNSLRLWQEGKLNKTQKHQHSSRNRVKRDEEVVCYGVELGCFRDEGPFDYLDMLPASPEEIGTRFLLYDKDMEPEVYSFFNHTKISSSSTAWNASRPTKVIVHGFGSTCFRMWANEMRLALLSVVDCNVICVDWENGASLPNYVKAAVNTRLVGKQLSLLIRKLVGDNPGVSSYEDFHLIGFSLGAHVAGFTGQELRNISRITGLDPAGPLFENYDKRVRLDSTDAIFVDVIHSNGDSLLMGGLGSWEPIGDLDFYPNGGRVQKGCSNLFLGAFRDFIWSSPPKDSSPISGSDSNRNGKSLTTTENDGRSLCNHRRAYRFFTESVSPRCPYPAFSCESYEKYLTGACFQWDNLLVHSAHMGYYADQHQNNPRVARQLQQQHHVQGQGHAQVLTMGPGQGLPIPPQSNPAKPSGKNFYLMTRDDEPFCANQYKLTLESSPPLGVPISTYGGVEAIVINGNDDFNETFLITQTHKDNMISGSVLQKLVVAHPALSDPSKLVLKYTAYKGWIYSGISRWSLDRLILTNAFGVSYSFCARGLLLPSGISVTVTLSKGICTITNFPFRYPHIHPYLPHYPIPVQHNNIGPGPAISVFRNEINESISGGGGSSGSTLLTMTPGDTPTSKSEHMDWHNDWQPIIVNRTVSVGVSNNNGASLSLAVTPTTSMIKDYEQPHSPPCINCSSSSAESSDNHHGEVNNEIDGSADRRSRQLSPIMLLPLSRAIDPRPVVLRTSRHMVFTGGERDREDGPRHPHHPQSPHVDGVMGSRREPIIISPSYQHSRVPGPGPPVGGGGGNDK